MLQSPPAQPGMRLEDVDTPALIIDLDAFSTAPAEREVGGWQIEQASERSPAQYLRHTPLALLAPIPPRFCPKALCSFGRSKGDHQSRLGGSFRVQI
jgi:hypothetical protein